LGDYFTIAVDRSELITPGRLTWQVDYAKTGSGGMQMMSGEIPIEINGIIGDITGDGKVDYQDLAKLAGQWLLPPGELSVDIVSDGVVDFKDFVELANHWLE
jgi:hypothetical protein